MHIEIEDKRVKKFQWLLFQLASQIQELINNRGSQRENFRKKLET